MRTVAVKVTAAILALLERRRVFLSHSGRPRWKVGDVIVLREDCEIEPYGQVYSGYALPRRLGSFSYSHTQLAPAAAVGRYCSIARDVVWMGERHPKDWASTSPFFYDPAIAAARSFRAEHGAEAADLPAFDPDPSGLGAVGNDVWIGQDAMIGRGVSIGDGAIIGARALVLEDVPPYSVVVGQPARVLRLRFPEPLVERFLALKWWRYAPDSLQRLPVSEPERFLDHLEELTARDAIREIRPAPLRGAEILGEASANS